MLSTLPLIAVLPKTIQTALGLGAQPGQRGLGLFAARRSAGCHPSCWGYVCAPGDFDPFLNHLMGILWLGGFFALCLGPLMMGFLYSYSISCEFSCAALPRAQNSRTALRRPCRQAALPGVSL